MRWPLTLLITSAALLFRRQGNPWRATLAKHAALVLLSLVLTTVLGGLMVWFR